MDPFLAVLAGGLVVVSMSLNSSLALRVGVFRGAVVNYVVGLAGALVLAAVVGFGPTPVWSAVPWWAWTGGILGVGIVAGSNFVFPRIPVVLAAVLLFLGQLGTGLAFDALREGRLPVQKLAGAALVVAGLVLSQRGQKTNI
jgi:transporter family-2 protein